jgi:hypothetical protein
MLHEARITADDATLAGSLHIPDRAVGLVLFAQ